MSKNAKGKQMGNTVYHEKLRPQFHFTAKGGWLNDPNGLLYNEGTYHMFFQHRPDGEGLGWGHAESPDLLHWEYLGLAIPDTDPHGPAWSGSAAVDEENVLGLQKGDVKTLAAFFTGRGTWGQYMYVSTDKGKTWEPFQEEPVVPMINPGNRDPKVFFHTESGTWVMVLWCRAPENTEDSENPQGVYTVLNSDDLVHWEVQSSIGPFFECPDLFELPVENTDERRWVMANGSGDYMIGDFDGKTFTPETELLKGDRGNNFYATQTWNNMPEGRIVQLTWMRNAAWDTDQTRDDRYPGMPFDQQMNFPCELTLKKTEEGIRLFRYPISEIETLYTEESEEFNGADITAADDADLKISRGAVLLCEVSGGILKAFDKEETVSGEVRILVDRVSVEIFLNKGEKVLSFCYLPENEEGLTVDGKADVRFIKSIWR